MPGAQPRTTSSTELVGTPGELMPAKAPARTEESDDALLGAFRRGERGVGIRLYRRMLPAVDGTLYRILGRRSEDHADLVQAAFEQIVLTLGQDRFAARCSLPSWASVIACHIGLTALRTTRRRRRVIDLGAELSPAHEPPAPAASPEQAVAAQRELEAVRAHLSEMDADRATALLLNAMGHSLQEMAELTGASVAAVQSRLSRARRELRERMQRTQPNTDAPEVES